ncbi:MAG TPA: hypothetical protein VEU32_14475 [Burkholderiales bacterium]|nr:hypothetical protein [Burkholderiales bacterium]
MRALIALLLAFALGGCFARKWDPHAPSTVFASADGGAVTVKHGNRLRLPLATDPKGGYEWHRAEPQILSVMVEGPADPEGISFTPVRSGEEKLRLEYRPVAGGPAQRTVEYDVTVPNDSAFWFRWFSLALP